MCLKTGVYSIIDSPTIVSSSIRQWSDFGSSNNLVCDCSALWLYEWMNSHSLQSSVICGKPPQHAGQDIRGLQKASFGCSEFVNVCSCVTGITNV